MIDFEALFDALISHQAASGFFEIVLMHEPKAPVTSGGITAASWFNQITPAVRASGLAATSYRVEFITRLYSSMLAEPQDSIDPTVLKATGHLLSLYNGDFELTDGAGNRRVMQVDLLGVHAAPLQARAGYLNLGNAKYRAMDVITPLIVDDAYPQAP